MNLVDLIAKKRDKQVLSADEIHFWINQITSKQAPDYQSAALLMAILLNGMNDTETSELTLAMMHSGDVIDLSEIEGITVDKHSTGGVGDKTSLVLTPLVAACGLKVAKMSGRGLGHTGGTLDKLESISGFNIFLDNQAFVKQVNEVGCAIIGQTANLVPADKALYALRDVTATVQSIPLIASSIMSKKLAASTQTILLDVKVGDGAFMKTTEQAVLLAETMIAIGKHLNRDVRAMLTDMNQPLGNMIGNALEVREAVETLQNKGPHDFENLCLHAASIMLVQGQLVENYQAGYDLAKECLRSGKAFEKFCQWIKAQGGDIQQIHDFSHLPSSPYKTPFRHPQHGYLVAIHTEALGHLAMLLGGGRQKKDDSIDYGVGLELLVKKGQPVEKNQPVMNIYHNSALTDELLDLAQSCFEFSETKPLLEPLILKVID